MKSNPTERGTMTDETITGRMFAIRKAGVTMVSGAYNEVVDALDNPNDFQDKLLHCIFNHVNGVWGDVDAHDAKVNDEALKTGARIVSEYTVAGVRLWVISDAAHTDDPKLREVTTIMRPEDY
jgi:hypothetical protein